MTILTNTPNTSPNERYGATTVLVLSILVGIYGCLKCYIIFRAHKSVPYYLMITGLICSLMGLIFSITADWIDPRKRLVFITLDSLTYFITISCTFLIYFYRIKTVPKLNRLDKRALLAFFIVVTVHIPFIVLYNLTFKNESYLFATIIMYSTLTFLMWIIETYLMTILLRKMVLLFDGKPDLKWILKTLFPLLLVYFIEASEILVLLKFHFSISWIRSMTYIIRINAVIVFFGDLVEVVEKGKLIQSAQNTGSILIQDDSPDSSLHSDFLSNSYYK
eukprot:NODE_378_length_8478_cov_0.790070.p4 type:complete len:277 gc:universal NODE_378_length_8478_cov_0.790070:7590-6760(-)